jgi:hypothetical protein
MGTLKHITISPDPDYMPLEKYLEDRGESFRKEVIQLIKENTKDGFYAGTLMIHPFRYEHLDGSACEDPDCPFPKSDHQYTYSPHAHFLGHAFFRPADQFFEQTGWIYKNIGPGEHRSLFATLAYELSHVGVFMTEEPEIMDHTETGRMIWSVVGQVYSHIGLYSNGNGGHEVLEKQQVVQHCEECGSHLLDHCVTMKQTADPNVREVIFEENLILGEHMIWEVRERWHLNIPTYLYTFEDGKASIHPGPDRKIYLEETFTTDDDGLIIEY